ncbi:MAG: PAS domain S-box protein [Thermodesulfobacteriota bacterium]
MTRPLRVLVIEDSEDDYLLLLRELEKGGFAVHSLRVETPEAMGQALREGTWDIILSDYHLPRFSGLNALKLFLASGIDIPFILVSGMIGEELAVEAMKAGAQDYIMKAKLNRLVPAVERELREAEQRQRRRRMELELEQEKERAARYLEIAGVAIVVINREGNVSLINHKGCQILEYQREEIIGRNWFDWFLPPEIRERVKKVFYQLMNEEVTPTEFFENPVLTKSGGERLISWRNSLIRDDTGRVLGTLSSGEDITERRKTEEQLRESEERYRDLVENINDVLYLLDKEGKVQYISPAVERMFGYKPEEVVGQTFLKFIEPEDYTNVTAILQKAYVTHVAFENIEVRLFNKSGETRWVRSSNRLMIDKDKFIGIRGILTDITTRKKAEEQSHQTLLNLRKAMNGIILAMAATVETRDPYTAGHQRRVADLAQAMAKELALPTEQIDGIRMAGIVHDLGKISVPAEILSKPTKLNEIEFSLIKTHPQISYDILKDIDFPWPVALTVYQHHERINGSGYPQGLKGEEMLLEARILAVADVVEAIASHRPYRPAHGIEAALEEIGKHKGTLYDAAAVEACLKLFGENRFRFD